MAISGPLQNLHTVLQMAETLLQVERRDCKNPPRQSEINKALGLRGGAIVLMVAGFEQFLKDLLKEQLLSLSRHMPPLKYEAFPDKLKINNTFETINIATKGHPYEQKIDKIHRLEKIDRACREILNNKINPDVFCITYGNPKAMTVSTMMQNIGINDLFDSMRKDFDKKWKKLEVATFLQDKLDEIVNNRHAVAHTAQATALNISRSDLKNYLKFIEILADSLEKRVSNHIKGIISRSK